MVEKVDENAQLMLIDHSTPHHARSPPIQTSQLVNPSKLIGIKSVSISLGVNCHAIASYCVTRVCGYIA
jgi:hypothetical protein